MRKEQKIGEQEIDLLTLLSGCPDGVTAYNLLTNHRVTAGAIFNVVERGLAHQRVNPVSGHSFSITRLFITQTGRDVLAFVTKQKVRKSCARVVPQA